MKTPKRLVSLMLCAPLVLNPFSAFAQDEKVPILVLESSADVALPEAPAAKVPVVEVSVVKTDSSRSNGLGENNSPELVRTRHADGSISIERWVAEDAQGNLVNQGKYVAFDTKGTQIVQGNYTMGQRSGHWQRRISAEQAKQLNPNLDNGFTAPFASTVDFSDGKLDGLWVVADSQGKAVLSWNYKSGKRDGESSNFDSSGKITQSINYKDNLADGPAKLSPTEPTQNFVQGKAVRVIEKFYPGTSTKTAANAQPLSSAATKQLESQESVLVPSALNVASSDWDNCRIEVLKPADKPVLQGRVVTFYENGTRKSEGSYENNQKNGTFVWWHADGQQQSVGEFRNDKQHSTWTWWHANGMKEATGEYADGIKVNEWSVWKADGKLASRSIAKEASSKESKVANLKNKDASIH